MNGRRVYPNELGHLILAPGDYGLDPDNGEWWAVPPKTGYPMGRLTSHTVVENPDGTITVTPSILVEGHGDRVWHGYLTNGEWIEV